MSAHKTKRAVPKQGHTRRLQLEALEDRRLLAFDFQNGLSAFDVSGDGCIAPRDALLVINELNEHGPHDLPSAPEPPSAYYDVSGDRVLTSHDVLLVINELNRHASAAWQPLVLTAALAPDSDPDGNGVVLQPRVTVSGQTMPRALVRLEAPGESGLVTVANADGHYQLSVELASGSSTLRITASDWFGQKVTAERIVRYGDVILDWNATLLNVIRDWTALSNDPYPNRIVPSQPPLAARNLAMVHAAMYDAVNAIERTHLPYHVDLVAPAGASPVAAAAAAAHRVASSLYREPDELAVFDAALAEALASIADGPSESLGIEVGRQVADAIIRWRSTDGAGARLAYAAGTEPGDWQRTFPDYLPPLLPQWPGVAPFAMANSSQFRPVPPPALDSAEYAAAVDEVMALGGLESTARTDEQTGIALFWSDGGGTSTPPGHWNQIAADVAAAQGTTLAENARLFALLNIGLADAGIASWDAKYAYDLWRPIDAIRRGDADTNEQAVHDATWTPLLKTPPFPTYTSGHSTFSGAADAVLTYFFGPDTAFASPSDGHTGFSQRPLSSEQIVTRSFTSFAQAADEAGLSRIYGGIHFQFDNAAGLAAGRALGSYVVGNFLTVR